MKSKNTQVFLPKIFWAYLKKSALPNGNASVYVQRFAEILDDIDQERISKEKNYISSSRYIWVENEGNTLEKVPVPPELKEIFTENFSYLSRVKLQYEEKVYLSSLMLLFRYTEQSRDNVLCRNVKYADTYPEFVKLNQNVLPQGLNTHEPPDFVGKSLTEFLKECNANARAPAAGNARAPAVPAGNAPAPAAGNAPAPAAGNAPAPAAGNAPAPAAGNAPAPAITLQQVIYGLQNHVWPHKNLSFKTDNANLKTICKTFWAGAKNKLILCEGLQLRAGNTQIVAGNAPAGNAPTDTTADQILLLNRIAQTQVVNITFSLKN